ncbi:hypothetical protein J2X32_003119 [Rheinheimera pacifica]|nr:hypothetical protein [Rheinheimera pacifica]
MKTFLVALVILFSVGVQADGTAKIYKILMF